MNRRMFLAGLVATGIAEILSNEVFSDLKRVYSFPTHLWVPDPNSLSAWYEVTKWLPQRVSEIHESPDLTSIPYPRMMVKGYTELRRIPPPLVVDPMKHMDFTKYFRINGEGNPAISYPSVIVTGDLSERDSFLKFERQLGYHPKQLCIEGRNE